MICCSVKFLINFLFVFQKRDDHLDELIWHYFHNSAPDAPGDFKIEYLTKLLTYKMVFVRKRTPYHRFDPWGMTEPILLLGTSCYQQVLPTGATATALLELNDTLSAKAFWSNIFARTQSFSKVTLRAVYRTNKGALSHSAHLIVSLASCDFSCPTLQPTLHNFWKHNLSDSHIFAIRKMKASYVLKFKNENIVLVSFNAKSILSGVKYDLW